MNDDECPQCPHPFGPHAFVTGEAPLAGGIVLCPDCDCATTWSIEGRPKPAMPDPDVIATMRTAVFG